MQETRKTSRYKKMELPKMRFQWTTVHSCCDQLVASIPLDERFNLKRIVAVSRGGLPAACIIAHVLGITEVHSIWTHSYKEDGAPINERVTQMPSEAMCKVWDSPETLVIDDILDSGRTNEFLRSVLLPHAKYGVLVARHSAKGVDYYGELIQADNWIIFPWEVDLPD